MPEIKKFLKVAGSVTAISLLAGSILYVAPRHFEYLEKSDSSFQEAEITMQHFIEKELSNNHLTGTTPDGAIFERMKSIQAENGVCAPIAKELRKEYNENVYSVTREVRETIETEVSAEGIHKIRHPENYDKIPEATKQVMSSDKVQERIKSIRAAGIKLESCLNSNPKPT